MEFFKKSKDKIRLYVSLIALVLCTLFFFLPVFSVSEIEGKEPFGYYATQKGVVKVDPDYSVDLSPINAVKFLLSISDVMYVTSAIEDKDGKYLEAVKNISESETEQEGYLYFLAFCYNGELQYEPLLVSEDVLGGSAPSDIYTPSVGIGDLLYGVFIAVLSIIIPIILFIKSLIYIISFFRGKFDDKKIDKLERSLKTPFVVSLIYIILGISSVGLTVKATVCVAFALSLIVLTIKALSLRFNDFTATQKTFVNITQLSGLIETTLFILCFVLISCSGAISEIMGQITCMTKGLSGDSAFVLIIGLVFCITIPYFICLTSIPVDRMYLSTATMNGSKKSKRMRKNYSLRNALSLLICLLLPLIYNVLADSKFAEISIDFMGAAYYIALVLGVAILALNIATNYINKKYIPGFTNEMMDNYMKGDFSA